MVKTDQFDKIFNASQTTRNFNKTRSQPQLHHDRTDYRGETKKMVRDLFFRASPSKQDSEMRETRKNFLLHGNGPITSQFEAMDGRQSLYQMNFKGQADTLRNVKVDNSDGLSAAFGLTPDPRVLAMTKARETGFSKDLYTFRDKNLKSETLLKKRG